MSADETGIQTWLSNQLRRVICQLHDEQMNHLKRIERKLDAVLRKRKKRKER
jgi:hypothetical protein